MLACNFICEWISTHFSVDYTFLMDYTSSSISSSGSQNVCKHGKNWLCFPQCMQCWYCEHVGSIFLVGFPAGFIFFCALSFSNDNPKCYHKMNNGHWTNESRFKKIRCADIMCMDSEKGKQATYQINNSLRHVPSSRKWNRMGKWNLPRMANSKVTVMHRHPMRATANSCMQNGKIKKSTDLSITSGKQYVRICK